MLIISALLLLLPFFGWVRAWRLRRLAAARLRLTRAVTQMELLMLDGTLRHGDMCHNRLFRAMSCAQFATRFPVPKMGVTHGSEDQEAIDRMRAELSGPRVRAVAPVVEFAQAFFLAVALSHPVRVLWYIVCQGAIAAWSGFRHGRALTPEILVAGGRAIRDRVASIAITRTLADCSGSSLRGDLVST